MAWEERNGRSYYYQKVRQDGRIVSRYIGAGPIAQQIAQLDVIRKERAALAREEALRRRAELRALASIPPELEQALAEARRATAAALTGAGFHRHKRQWRKNVPRAKTHQQAALAEPTPAPIETTEQRNRRIVDAMCVQNPPKEARKAFSQLLGECPDLAYAVGTLPSMVLDKRLGGVGLPIAQESIRAQIQRLRKDLAGEHPTELEKLIIEAIMLCYQDYYGFALLLSSNAASLTNLEAVEQWDRVLAAKETRYLRAIGELARARRLLNLPGGQQVNINLPGAQQVNVVGDVSK